MSLKKSKLTSFQIKVFKIVNSIPLGEVRTYKWIAEKTGKPGAYRAVGSALNKNPYPILIPCHRVIKSNGDIGGYSQGRNFKKNLLLLEKYIAQLLK